MWKKKAKKKSGKWRTGIGNEALDDLSSAFAKKRKKEPRKWVNKISPRTAWAAIEGNKPVRSEAWAMKDGYRKILLAKKNIGEDATKALLKHITLDYERELPISERSSFFFIDFYIRTIDKVQVNIALEIDGSSHDSDEAKRKDRVKDKVMLRHRAVKTVLRITSNRVRSMTIGELKAALVSCKPGIINGID